MFTKIKKYFIFTGSSKGLTLIEVLVTASLIVFISTLIIRNGTLNAVNLERVANVVASDFRLAQYLALSSRQYQYTGDYPGDPNADPVPRNRCGYGISQSQSDNTTYFVYAGPPTLDPTGNPRSCNARSFQPSVHQDTPAYKTVLLDPQNRVVFDTNPRFKDVFYEPPGPTTFIQNSSSSPGFQKVTIMKAGLTNQQQNDCKTAVSSNCIYVCAYLSGRIEVTRGPNCP